MIQRIQSLWLLLAALCMMLCFMTPVANFIFADKPTEGQTVESRLDLVARGGDSDLLTQYDQPVVHYNQGLTGMPTWPMVTLAILVIVLSVVTIFLFKNRTLQLRLIGVAFLLNVAYAFVVLFWAVDKYAELLSDGMGGAQPEVSWRVGAFAHLVSLVFLFLAQRGIRKDEALVRAADRLR